MDENVRNPIDEKKVVDAIESEVTEKGFKEALTQLNLTYNEFMKLPEAERAQLLKSIKENGKATMGEDKQSEAPSLGE